MQNFVRITKLHDIGGRSDYIMNPERQEKILCCSPWFDWKPYSDFEKTHRKSKKKNNEGREVIIALPNEWQKLSVEELFECAERLAIEATGKSTDLQWAVHWNHRRTNLHMHVIFSERTRVEQVKWYDRDIYLTSSGKVARKSDDRACDISGNVLPPVHRRGDVMSGGFSAKNSRYKDPAWPKQTKQAIYRSLSKMGVELRPQQPPSWRLHEYHEGKGSDALKIAVKNRAIRLANRRMELMSENSMLSQSQLADVSTACCRALQDGLIPIPVMIDSSLVRVKRTDIDGFKRYEKTARYIVEHDALATHQQSVPDEKNNRLNSLTERLESARKKSGLQNQKYYHGRDDLER